MAAITASASAAALRKMLSAPSQPLSAASTEAATNAPKLTKAEWPKFSTSISPKIRLKPEAMRNTIIPIASPATVSVAQDEGAPISTKPSAARASGSR